MENFDAIYMLNIEPQKLNKNPGVTAYINAKNKIPSTNVTCMVYFIDYYPTTPYEISKIKSTKVAYVEPLGMP